jgi:calcineurin-like phosphoesterase family protein
MATYYCSDPHAFHGSILKYCRRIAFMTPEDREVFLDLEARGADLGPLRMSAASIERMNWGLVENINARVEPGDTLWCLGDWTFGRGSDYRRNARWFRDQIRCRDVRLIWGNHDDRSIRDLFTATHDQIRIRDGDAVITLNHYPMITWDGQHKGTVETPNIHLHGHVHALYQREPEACPVRFAEAWAALDVGFDGHDYQVWSLPEILEALRPRLLGLQALKRERRQFDPFRGRGEAPARSRDGDSTGPAAGPPST